MAANYDGLTRNIWPGTWSPASSAPIALDTELRGTLQSITGSTNDQLTNIPGQRIQEGMLVYVKNSYISGIYTRTGDRYYTYKLQVGQSRNSSTGAVPNAEINWSEVTFGSSGSGSDYTLPIATSSVLGGIKIGSGVSISLDGTISVDISSLTATPLPIKSNGTILTTQPTSINFTGDSVTTTKVGDDVTVEISGMAIGINLDGGGPGSVYGGINPIDGGYI